MRRIEERERDGNRAEEEVGKEYGRSRVQHEGEKKAVRPAFRARKRRKSTRISATSASDNFL